MVRLNQVSKIFHIGKPNEIIAVKKIDLHIPPAEFLVIVGANGSGKSTLLNLIAGNLLPTKGTIEIDGNDVSRFPEYKRSRWIARVFQNPLHGTAPDLTIIENFRLAALRTSSKSLTIGLTAGFRENIREKIATLGLGLEDKLNQPMGSLSGGQRQALSLLMSVMADIRVLLLDEPTAALDPRSAEVVLTTANKLIEEYSITTVMVTHNLKDAHLYGSRIVQLHNGNIVRDIGKEQKKVLGSKDMYEWFL